MANATSMDSEPNYKPDSTGTTVVQPDTKWIPIDDFAPWGMRVQVIDKSQGIAYLRTLLRNQGWTHWHPVPTFD